MDQIAIFRPVAVFNGTLEASRVQNILRGNAKVVLMKMSHFFLPLNRVLL